MSAVRSDWLRTSPWDGGPRSLGEHVAAIEQVMAGTQRLWLGPFEPPKAVAQEWEHAVLVVPTSGSTGAAKAVALSLEALIASQDATAAALAGDSGTGQPLHGHWLPLLPATHIAGVQVIARAVRTAQVLGLDRAALTDPLPDLSGHFDAWSFTQLASASLEQARAAGLPALTSLVPTQLGRVLQDADATALLSRFSAVLVGGAATPPALLEAARHAGITVRTTYGSSETAGGCVYDRRPLPGVELDIVDPDPTTGEGRLRITSPTLALGYVHADGTADDGGVFQEAPSTRPAGPDHAPGPRSFLTSDLARLDADGLRILGRADDVLITGGRKVLPQDVERAILESPALSGIVADVVVVGVPDPEWGQRIEALIVPVPGTSDPESPETVRAALRAIGLPAHALPKAVHITAALPRLGIGKIDRAAARSIASAAPRPHDSL